MNEIRTIDAWLKAAGMKESRLGLLACANSRAIGRIRSGAATLQTWWAVEAYIKANPARPKDAKNGPQSSARLAAAWRRKWLKN
jgi:hypothetical protein